MEKEVFQTHFNQVHNESLYQIEIGYSLFEHCFMYLLLKIAINCSLKYRNLDNAHLPDCRTVLKPNWLLPFDVNQS